MEQQSIVMPKAESPRNLQKQFARLFSVLVLITAVNAAFFWKTLNQLFLTYHEVARSQRLVGYAGDLERNFFEENKIRNSGAMLSAKTLPDLRKDIRKDFKLIRDNVTDKQAIEAIKKIEKSWKAAHDEMATMNLLVQTRSFIGKQQGILQPLEENADAATEAVGAFVCVYLVIFVLTVGIMSQYLKRRVFFPLNRLSEKMKHFQAGHHELPPQTALNDEISNLESQFYDMAGRVSDTFKELQELDRVKTDFLSIASHELRTPMTSVKGSLSLILSGNIAEINPDVKDLLTIAEKETDRLIRLINDILDLTKMETKKLPLDKKWHDVRAIIDNVIEGTKGFFEVAKVNVEVAPYRGSISANVDRDRIQQVITNLVSNAVKFSPAGSTVHIGYEPFDTGLVITVKDSGQGIEPENLAHMFEKFRSTDSKSKMIKGTGLGLPICKALVEQHGGQIGVESEPTVGSTFYFTLPEARVTPTADAPMPQGQTGSAA